MHFKIKEEILIIDFIFLNYKRFVESKECKDSMHLLLRSSMVHHNFQVPLGEDAVMSKAVIASLASPCGPMKSFYTLLCSALQMHLDRDDLGARTVIEGRIINILKVLKKKQHNSWLFTAYVMTSPWLDLAPSLP